MIAFLLLTVAGYAQDTKENADFKLAVSLYNDRLYELASEQFHQFITNYPNTQQGVESRFYLGLIQLQLKKFDDARFSFQNFALQYPDNPKAPDAWWNVAEAYIALKDFREAALAFERVKTFHPKSKQAPAALLKASEYFELAGDHENSRKILRTIVQDYTANDVVLPARLKLSVVYFDENQFELSRIEAKRVTEQAKEPGLKAQALLMIAKSLGKLGKYEEAQTTLDEIQKGSKSTSYYYSALLLFGSLYKDMGNHTDAIAAWMNVANDSAGCPVAVRQEAFVELGDEYVLREDFPKANSFYERAAAIKGPMLGKALERAGRGLMKTKSPKIALGYFNQVLEDRSLGNDRSITLSEAVHAALACKEYRDVLRFAHLFNTEFPRNSNSPEILLAAARVARDEMTEYRQAITFDEKLLAEFPSHRFADDALFDLAQTYRAMGSFDVAIQLFESIERRFPSSNRVEQARDAVRCIRAFELKNKESGLERLTLLIGDLIAQESKAELAYRLAEIYFQELKDYERAAEQYRIALQSNLSLQKQPLAWGSRAKSFEYLAWKARLERKSDKNMFAQTAIACYDSLLKNFSMHESAGDALLAQVQLKLQLAGSVGDVRKLQAGLQLLRPVPRQYDAILLLVGKAYSTHKSYDDAVGIFRMLLGQYPQSPSAPEAFALLGESLLLMGKNDSAQVVLEQYLARYPAHRYSAKAHSLLAKEYAAQKNSAKSLAHLQSIERSFGYSEFADDVELIRASLYDMVGDYVNASKSYEKIIGSRLEDAIEFSDVSSDLLFRLAVSCDQAGRKLDAKKYYTFYLLRDASSERSGQVYYALAAIARDERNITLATRYLQESGRLSGSSSNIALKAALEAAELYFRVEDYTNAITRFTEVVQKVQGDSAQQYLQSRIVVCYFRLNNVTEADKKASAFFKAFPQLERYAAEFEYERGMYSLRKDDVSTAQRHFDYVQQKYPATPAIPFVLYGSARVAEVSTRIQDAARLYETVLQQYPESPIVPRVQLSLGNLYYQQEKWDPAARQYRAILDNESKSPELVQYAMNNIIIAFKEMGLIDAALDLTRKYIDRFPDDPELIGKRIDVGVLQQKLGYYDQAILHLQNILESADADLEAEVRYYIGEAYFYKGDYQQAILEFLKVPYLVTKRTKVDWIATSYYMAGQSYEKLKKYDQAIGMYRQIIERQGIDATFKAGAQKEIDRVTAAMNTKK
ncbi:MAG: tetratricopeptide repeat protein [bacterium]